MTPITMPKLLLPYALVLLLLQAVAAVPDAAHTMPLSPLTFALLAADNARAKKMCPCRAAAFVARGLAYAPVLLDAC